MARKSIKKKTYYNFMVVKNAIQIEKGYNEMEAIKIAEHLFEILESNPQGNIWVWYDNILCAE